MAGCGLAEALNHERAETCAAPVTCYHDPQGAQGVRLAACLQVSKALPQGEVPAAVGKLVICPVPPEGNRPALGGNPAVVEQRRLVITEILVEPNSTPTGSW
jgi:hypothetical protein